MREPLLLPVCALAAGILTARAVVFGSQELLAALAAFLILAAIGWRWRAPRAGYVAVLAAMACAGALTAVRHALPPAPEIDTTALETVVMTGCVVTPSAFHEGREQFVAELAPAARARVSVFLKDGEEPPELRYGQRIEFAGKVRRVRNFHNPAAFDNQTYLARQQIYWTVSARRDSIRVLPGACGSPFWAFLFRLRTAGLRRVEELYAGNDYDIGMMQSTLIGDSAKLDKAWTESFRQTGTYHALVISGLHVTVLAGCLLFLLRFCPLSETAALGISALAAWLYALVSGWNAPVLRASGGFTLFLIGCVFHRRGRILNLLAAVALVYLLFDPAQLTDASFQLSFLAVAAIGALAVPLLQATSARYAAGLSGLAEQGRDLVLEPAVAQFRVELRLLAETASMWTRIPEKVCLVMMGSGLRAAFFVYELVAVSAVMQVGLALPMALYFHRVSLSGLSANVIVVPLMTAVVPIGFFAIFTHWKFPAAVAGSLLWASQRVVDWHARLEPSWRVPDPPVWLAVAFVAALVALAMLARLSKPGWRICLAAVLGLFALILVHPFAPRVEPGQLEFTAIDVGQGDALFLAFPSGRLMMVDTGGIPANGRCHKPAIDIGEDVVAPYLWSRSIRRLDVIVSTHGHEDHMGGMPAIIEDFHPSELWTGATPESPQWTALRAQARRFGVKIVPLRAGQAFEYGGARVAILSPPPDYTPGPAPQNNDSLVMTVAYGRHRLLLTGDAERLMEDRMLADSRVPRVDVLKLGHHGSRTSSTEEFLAAARPAFAVVSEGFENSFGFPHPEVLGRLGEFNVELFRTDLDGLTTLRTDGKRFTAETNPE